MLNKIYRDRSENNLGHEFTKDIPHLTVIGELWGIFSKFLREKVQQDIESELQFVIDFKWIDVSCCYPQQTNIHFRCKM